MLKLLRAQVKLTEQVELINRTNANFLCVIDISECQYPIDIALVESIRAVLIFSKLLI